MAEAVRDRWADWLLERRFGGDREHQRRMLEELAPVRDRVLDNAELRPDDVLLDVGAGDGLIAFGALDRLGRDGRVILSDISRDLLDHARVLAEEAGVAERCDFVLASADELPFEDESVDVVTTRSVLIYLDREQKARAFREFHRVLRGGGRISIFEPINRFGSPAPPGWFCGYDLSPIAELVAKVMAVMSPRAENTLIDFDERDLFAWAEDAGFEPIRLDYIADLEPGSWLAGTAPNAWQTVLRSSGNPLAPTVGEAIEQALTPAEAATFEAHLRPLVEAQAGKRHGAHAYLRATKP
jgi:ubiquinone/menaquinone biosynthesis C-methylase UbiE